MHNPRGRSKDGRLRSAARWRCSRRNVAGSYRPTCACSYPDDRRHEWLSRLQNPSRRMRPPSNFGRPRDALGSRSAQRACRVNSRCPGIGPRRPACDASTGRSPDEAAMGSAAGCVSVAFTRSGGARSDLAYFLDAARQVLRPVQKVKGGEVVRPAVIVLATLARPEHEPGIVTGCRLARLNVHVIGVHRDLSADGYAGEVGAKIVGARREAERVGELLEPAAGVLMERTLCLAVICNRLSEIEVGGCLGHDQESESG